VVVGLGYVGLPIALSLLADHSATGLDSNPRRLTAIRERRVDLLPEDLALLDGALSEGRFRLTDEPDVLETADAVLICVPTPVDDHLTPDLTALRAACATVVAHARAGQTIVLMSTTFVGTTRALLARPLEERGFQIGRDVYVAFSPERMDPGRNEHASHRTPRVLGGMTSACATRAHEVVAARLTDAEIHVVSSPEAAELTKLHENTFRAVNLALANEFAEICSALRIDPIEVIGRRRGHDLPSGRSGRRQDDHG
jgi:UDP-N-acetyl-D-glucosamine dehydrogenase